MRNISWILPPQFTVSTLEQRLSKTFSLRHVSESESTRRWFDSFDWRLYGKKRILTLEKETWLLTDFSNRPISSLQNIPNNPRFARQFPVSPLGTTLSKRLAVRALIQLGSACVHTLSLQIHHRKGKGCLDMLLQKISNSGTGTQLTVLHCAIPPGQPKWFLHLVRLLQDRGATKKRVGKTLYHLAMEDSNRAPLDYSSGYTVQLTPKMKSSTAVAGIHTALRSAIQQNWQGVVDDTDPEFLHDMRVAIRRTRSSLSLIKGVLSEEVSEFLKEEFQYLGQITGPVRDLDVYLMKEEQYSNQLPETLRAGLVPFFASLVRRRNTELKVLVTALRGARFQGILTEWPYLLEEPDVTSPGGKRDIPIAALAGTIIRKRFRRILCDGRKINDETREGELHRLRIQCKKLRYSLEFFASLYDLGQMKQLIRQLKMLQNNLGDFNDLSVQQEMLLVYLFQMKEGQPDSRQSAAAIGGLICELSRQHQWVRDHFEETFSHFCRADNMALYHKVFG